MLSVQKWAKDKPFLIALFAPQVAASVRDVNGYLRGIRERKIMSQQFKTPPLRSWYAMYRRHRLTIDYLRTLIGEFSDFGHESIKKGDRIVKGLTELSKHNPLPEDMVPTEEVLNEIKKLLQAVLDASFKDLESELIALEIDEEVKESALDFIQANNIETAFFMLVYFPCILLYRTHPTRIYRAARNGDTQALEKLIRLDPLMLHDPAIGKQIQSFRLNNRLSVYEKLLDAARKAPRQKATAKKMKYSMAGFISALASHLNYQLTEPEIRCLFDAVAQDAYGLDTDEDLADSPESFAQAILRDRKVWLKHLIPDKKK